MTKIKITTKESGIFCTKLIQECNDIWQQPVAPISEDVFFSVPWGYRGNAFR